MGLLLEQFATAAREFHSRLPQPEKERRESPVVFWTMHYTGGSSVVKRLDPRDTSKLSWEERRELTKADVDGYHSVEQMQCYLGKFIKDTPIIETFLIPSLVRALEAEFQYWVDSHDQRVAGRHEKIQELRDMEADPELREIYLKAAREVHEQFVAEGKLPPEPLDEENYFQEEIGMLEKISAAAPDEKASSELHLALWRDVTKEMLTPENLERARTEEIEEWRKAYEGK